MDGPILTLIRGVPGSGKTFIGKAIAVASGAVYIDADMWRLEKYGHYVYDPKDNKEAHAWCVEKTRQVLTAGTSVVNANVFQYLEYLLPYEGVVKEAGATLQLVTVDGELGDVHNVPREVKDRMRRHFQPLTINDFVL